MVDATTGRPLPCERCARRMFPFEQLQQFCIACARELGLARICDPPGFEFVGTFFEVPMFELADLRGESYSSVWMDEYADSPDDAS